MSTNHRQVSLSHGAIEHTILVPTHLFLKYSQVKDQFQKTLPPATDGYAADDEPASPAELFAKFVGFAAASAGDNHEMVVAVLHEFQSRFFPDSDIHSFAASLLADETYPTTVAKVKNVIKAYFDAITASSTAIPPQHAELVSKSLARVAKPAAIFGGQGNTDDYFDELRDLNHIYHGVIAELLSKVAAKLSSLVKSTENVDKIYTQGFDVLRWLNNPDQCPDHDYLLSVPVLCPLICVIQLAHYVVACRSLGVTPGEFRDSLVAVTGHSQGLVTAVAIASSDSWESFYENAIKAVAFMFFIGARSLATYPRTTLPPTMLQDSLENGEGRPSPMLSIRDLPMDDVEKFVAQTNNHLPQEKHVAISLVNGGRNVVVSGPPESLYGLNLALRNNKAPAGLDQARVPFSDRKLKFSNRFLPIFAPFHSHLLQPATAQILDDLEAENLSFPANSLKIPVYDTYNGANLQTADKDSVADTVTRCITQLPVHWEKATSFDCSHLLDFGPGGASGLGVLTHRNKQGTGARVVICGALDINPEDDYGYKQELFCKAPNSIKWAPNWLLQYQPRLARTKAGKVFVDTKFSRLLGRPPLMVPGMTPTTVNADIVAATINAGYHIELAGGGYFNSAGMEAALNDVVKTITPGCGIGINLIYVNPRMLQWGIPLIKELRAKGFPILSMTIGAGVPSLEVASEYINDLGLTHLGLKPGSIESISQVITIAKNHPDFPIVLQWTGGRGGGHHSFEDFHQPVLQMYSKIRTCSNIVLVAGSGFGSDEDTYPYLTGSWSRSFGYPPMPFDGVLFGSRVMTAKEAHTSYAAKQAIADCAGVPDSQWETTYKKPAGGIITVRSEMGEPIHKIATRGVMLWKEMDDTIFSLPKNKLKEALAKKKDYIIGKLNRDFQKPWFGVNANGVCDLQDMTYQEVANRMIELMYVKKSDRWIDTSLRNFFGDFLRRVEERFTAQSDQSSLLQSFSELSERPQKFTDAFFDSFPLAKTQFISEEDCDYFLMLCSRPAQKPAPFVPVLDERFEFFFKKDSLWQSEDLESVVDEDVQRTCILHGPVAARFTNKVNEPIKEILDNIHQGHVDRLIKEVYGGNLANVPEVEYFGGEKPEKLESVDGVTISGTSGNSVVYEIGSTVPEQKQWLQLLAGDRQLWLYALLMANRIVQGSNHVDNSVHDVLGPAANMRVEVSARDDPSATKLSVYELIHGDYKQVVEIALVDKTKSVIRMSLIEHRTADGAPVALDFLYQYKPEDGFAPIVEVMADRNERIKAFYWKLWFGSKEAVDLNIDVNKSIVGDEVKISGQDIAEFTHAIGNTCEAFITRPNKQTLAPMDFAIVVGWKAIMKAIFPKTVDGDLLKLVHLSNGYRMIPGAEPLKKDDVVRSEASIRAVVNQASGKMVEVVGTIFRENKPVMEVTAQFLYRGEYKDFHNTFQKVAEDSYEVHLATAKDVAILRSKEWFYLEQDRELLGSTLTFRCESTYKFQSANVYSSIHTSGKALLELPTKEVVQVALIEYEAGASYGNPVMDYFSRHGKTIEQAVKFENAIPISLGEELTSRAPSTNEPYAKVSGDYNPIHVSRVFASYAKLPGTITHGMYLSGSIRALVEEWAANSVASRVRAFKADFVGMVLPNDTLQTSMEHVGMVNGRKIIKIETRKVDSDEAVLAAEAEIEQPVTTYVFTGQGSQEQGMGMDLYNNSAVAREVWDRADRHFVDNYGFSILDIVRNNPNELTVHFGGAKGRRIRDNYVSMMFETIGDDGEIRSEKIFKSIDHTTASYTFVSPTGLLSATQFTQPALTLMEKASYEDIKAKGLVPTDIMFAGHSLGEYSALSSLANVMPIESLVDVVFYRGMTMQVAVPRDDLGRSNYSMCAVNPSRVSGTFDDAALRFVVNEVHDKTGWLLEIVNYNVENAQYVTAGDLRALDTLTNVLNVIKLNKIDIVKLQESMSLDQVRAHLKEIIDEVAAQAVAKPQPIDLQRGFAVIPLKGISVPFHSSYLMSGVKPFERFLGKKIPRSSVNPNDLIGKYIPNLTAKPFQITREYFEEVYALTKSDKIKAVLDNWENYEKA